VKIRFWGVRGSFAMAGPQFLRYGGNTTTVEVLADDGRRIVIDLGTGATELAKQLMAGDFGAGRGKLSILLSHTHLDHIQGLPFFTPFFVKGNQIRILGASPLGTSLEETLQKQLNPHYSPLYGLQNLAAGVSIEPLALGTSFEVDGFAVTTCAVPHGSIWNTGLRIAADDKTVVFLSDVEYPDPQRPVPEALALADGCDLLIHDAMFSDEEYDTHRGWGHSPVSSAIAVAEGAGVGRLALFHHSPDATDDAIDSLVHTARQRTEIPVFAAAEGPYLPL
jgi:phosphoribosyl 1,2-cyclic phosphodiesterase